MKTKIFKPVLMAIIIPSLFSYDFLFGWINTGSYTEKQEMRIEKPKEISKDNTAGWIKKGSNPENYEMGIIKGSGQDGKNAAIIKSTNEVDDNGFGTFMQMSSPEKFLGKQIKMTGYMKSENVTGWAGLWLRVDQKDPYQPLSFDNMQDRAITGTTDWKKYVILLCVPENATNIAYGALLAGAGKIWFDNVTFEVVDNANNPPKPEKSESSDNSFKTDVNKNKPVNLDFEK